MAVLVSPVVIAFPALYPTAVFPLPIPKLLSDNVPILVLLLASLWKCPSTNKLPPIVAWDCVVTAPTSTVVNSTLNAFSDTKFSLDFQAVVAVSYKIDLLVDPNKSIPPPLALASVGTVIDPKVILLDKTLCAGLSKRSVLIVWETIAPLTAIPFKKLILPAPLAVIFKSALVVVVKISESSMIIPEFWILLPSVPLNLGIALSVELAGPITSPPPIGKLVNPAPSPVIELTTTSPALSHLYVTTVPVFIVVGVGDPTLPFLVLIILIQYPAVLSAPPGSPFDVQRADIESGTHDIKLEFWKPDVSSSGKNCVHVSGAVLYQNVGITSLVAGVPMITSICENWAEEPIYISSLSATKIAIPSIPSTHVEPPPVFLPANSVCEGVVNDPISCLTTPTKLRASIASTFPDVEPTAVILIADQTLVAASEDKSTRTSCAWNSVVAELSGVLLTTTCPSCIWSASFLTGIRISKPCITGSFAVSTPERSISIPAISVPVPDGSRFRPSICIPCHTAESSRTPVGISERLWTVPDVVDALISKELNVGPLEIVTSWSI